MSACLKKHESLEGECVPFLKARNLRDATQLKARKAGVLVMFLGEGLESLYRTQLKARKAPALRTLRCLACLNDVSRREARVF